MGPIGPQAPCWMGRPAPAAEFRRRAGWPYRPATVCTAVLSGGVAVCGATGAPQGTDAVTGTYSGGNGYASSSGTATLTVTTG